jgi:hypothetical protein
MYGNIACIAAAVLGIDVGWQPLPDGGLEYIIQIEPDMLEAIASGEPIRSDLPSYVRDVRAYQIVVGTGELPRELPPEQIDSPGWEEAGSGQPASDRLLPPPASPSGMPNLSAELPPLRQPGAQPPAYPELFQEAEDSQQIDAQQTTYVEPPASAPGDQPMSPSEQRPALEQSQSRAPSKPWAPLIVALLTLCGSLAGNVYLGWITWDTRSRYRAMLQAKDDHLAV